MPGISISWYKVNITINENVVLEQSVSNDELIYNVSEFGLYCVSVVAVIEPTIEGEMAKIQIEIPTGTLIRWCLFNYLYLLCCLSVVLKGFPVTLFKKSNKWVAEYGIEVHIH